MVVMVSLKTIYFSFVLSSNAPEPNVISSDVCTIIFCKFEQSPNPLTPIERWLLDRIVTDVNLVHL